MKSPAARQRLRWLSFTGAAIVVLCFFILSCMPAVWITGWQNRISDGLISLWNGITESTASHSTVLSLYSLTGPLLHIAGYFLLGMLLTVWAAGGFQETGEGIPGFFGMLYPEYCFSQVPEDGNGQVPMERKLTFRWLRGL